MTISQQAGNMQQTHVFLGHKRLYPNDQHSNRQPKLLAYLSTPIILNKL